jgi:hypothetical protein
MKRIIGQIALFVLSFTLFACIYIGVFKISVTAFLILLAIMALYSVCMGIGEKSMQELKKYEQKQIHFGLNEKDHPKILLFSLFTLFPAFFCVVLVTLVPLYTYEVWLITVFPCILLNCLPMSSVLEEYHGLTRRKIPFLVCSILITALLCFIGIIVSHLLLK